MDELMESATYREIFESGKISGEEKVCREHILKNLKRRFKVASAPAIEKKLQEIKSIEKLDSLFDKSYDVDDLKEFEALLNVILEK